MRILIFLALLVSGPAFATSDSGHGPASGHAPAADQHEEEVQPNDPLIVEMPVLIAPVLVRGRLEFYYYVGVQLHVEEKSNVESVKEFIPQIQDAFVRDVHRKTLTTTVDSIPQATAELADRLSP
jgi:flagellar basal body-associated protein FliL